MSFSKEINTAIARNIQLKSKILAVIFGLILLFQIGVMFFGDIFKNLAQHYQNKWIFVFGPGVLLIAVISEIISLKYVQNIIIKDKSLSQKITYLIVFIETSFPSAILLFVFYIFGNKNNVTVIQLLNSPPVSMYFIMILLSSLMLDYKVSLFAGTVATIEYYYIAHFLIGHDSNVSQLDTLNAEIKSVFIFITGAMAGFVSYKTREAVLSSLHSKDALINKLDHLVHEKTEEIRNQKNEIEEKNKDIIDSITYAKRIQYSQLPTEKYITKTLNRLRNK